MLLKSLEVQGFKTFPDKTTLSFDRGITAVVGPNGSGKSNISDAVRWVLGEQSIRVLRCSKMEDVVFSGTPSRRAQGFAEVTLTIDNTDRDLNFDSDAVSVTRRYYRSGDSEYLINKASVRLKDIHELFMDTGLGRDGYSIIGQGKIDSIVAARSEDRREIFEEAAGISRFRYRKVESERRLNQAEENLLRLRDILSELEARVEPLREQAEKAQQYLEMSGEKRTLEIGLWLNTLNHSGKVIREHDDKIVIARNQYETAEAQIEKMGQDAEENYQKMNGLAAEMDGLRNEAAAQEEEAVRRDGDAQVLENDILHNNQNIERIQREIQESARSGQDMEQEIEAKRAEISQKEALVSQKDREFIETTENLENLRRGMTESSGKMEEYTRGLAKLSADSSDAKVASMTAASSISEITLRLDAVREAVEKKAIQLQELAAAEKDYESLLQEADDQIASLQNAARGYELRLTSRRQKLENAKELSDKLHLDTQEHLRRAKLLEELERNLEGFAQSVKVVMRETARGSLGGVHGPVSRLIRVPQEYAVAIETALGAAMQNIVVSTEHHAKSAINLLKQRDGGRATFLPLTTIKGNVLRENGLDDCPGFVGVAGQLCTCDSQYQGVLDSLLGRIAVAEDLDSAVAIAKRYGYRFRVVTLDGQVVNTGGSLTGGSLARNSGLLSRATEIERIKTEAEALQKKEAEASAALKAITEEAAAAEASLTATRGELASAQEERIKLEAQHGRVRNDRRTIGQDVAALEQEQESAGKRLTELQAAKDEAEQKSLEIAGKIADLQKELSKITGNREELDRQCNELSQALQELRFAGMAAQKDKEALMAAIEEIQRRRQDHEGKADALRNEIESVKNASAALTGQIEALRVKAEALRESAKQSRERAEALSGRRIELDRVNTELRALEKEKSAERENVGHELARLEERKANLQKEYDEIISRLWEEYELTRREAEEVGETVEDVAKGQRRLNELKNKIKSLGTVNVAAVEEYKEVSERYEFLKNQIGDVEKSRDELRKLIGELTYQMRELFIERFAEINGHFLETFKELFGGGVAGLKLTNPEDVLNSGIEISVQPPGKIVTHLESLSGGEKALVAIALYFAIMKVSPPPFCMLDEIEAALDDVNVDRFASYLRRMTKNTQFIVITHRRGTMEEADVLYGVTMQDEGVSKLLELHASEIEQKLGMK